MGCRAQHRASHGNPIPDHHSACCTLLQGSEQPSPTSGNWVLHADGVCPAPHQCTKRSNLNMTLLLLRSLRLQRLGQCGGLFSCQIRRGLAGSLCRCDWRGPQRSKLRVCRRAFQLHSLTIHELLCREGGQCLAVFVGHSQGQPPPPPFRREKPNIPAQRSSEPFFSAKEVPSAQNLSPRAQTHLSFGCCVVGVMWKPKAALNLQKKFYCLRQCTSKRG